MRVARRIVFLLLILAPTLAWAAISQNTRDAVQGVESLEAGRQPWRSPDVTEDLAGDDLRRLRGNAAAGDPQAQANLGLCYQSGYGVMRNLVQAATWYEKAAAGNHAGAQNNLAMLYEEGTGVPFDRGKAHQLYMAAAMQGLVQAQFNVGANFGEGVAVVQNWREARRWYEKAAAQGNLAAMSNLGNIFLLGRGVPVDLERARKLLLKPAEAGLAISQFSLASSYFDEQKFAAAAPWLKKSAEGGFYSGHFYWAVSLMEGKGVEKNLAEALKWARDCIVSTSKAAPKQLPDAQALLAQVLLEQPGVSDGEAFQSATASADATSMRGQYLLGLCYYRGAGVARDVPGAMRWYRRAAEQGFPDAAASLGCACEMGDGVDRSIGEAVKWYRVAMKGGHAPVCMRVGMMLLDGNGVPRNLEEAAQCFRSILRFVPNDARANLALAEVQRRMQGGPGEEIFHKGLEMARAAEDGQASMEEALRLLNEAAESQHHQQAAATLATIYRRGLGVPRDEARAEKLLRQIVNPTDRAVLHQMAVGFLLPGNATPGSLDPRALAWFQRSAGQGYAAAQSALGFYYLSAPDGIRDPVEAMKWLFLAGMEAYPAARMHAERLRPTMSQAQLEEAMRRAREFRPVTE